MSEVKIENVEKNTDSILEKVGKVSYVNWETFTQSSTEVAKSIDDLTSSLAIFREVQHKSFIQTMKKLKGLDIPDTLQAVKSKKLPKEALRGVLSRFKLSGDNIELVQSVQQLKENAEKQFNEYVNKNRQFVQALNEYTKFVNSKAQESGLLASQQIVQNNEQNPKPASKFNLSQEKASALASEIKIQYLPGFQNVIGLDTYRKIVESTFKLVKQEFQKLTRTARTAQRQNLKNHSEYLRLMNQFLVNSEGLVNEGLLLLANKVGVTETKLNESQEVLMNKGYANELLMVQSQLRQQLKESLTPKQEVSVEVAVEVVKYQSSLLTEKVNDLKSILSGLEKGPQALQMIPMLLTLILNDYVFQKFGYEEEEFMRNLNETAIRSNPELINVFASMESGIMGLMQKLDVIPPDVAMMMKQQQEYMAQMGGNSQGMMPPGMMPPGMFPPQSGLGLPGQSTNPMDMLQQQQMQQMQQMFAQMGLLMPPPK